MDCTVGARGTRRATCSMSSVYNPGVDIFGTIARLPIMSDAESMAAILAHWQADYELWSARYRAADKSAPIAVELWHIAEGARAMYLRILLRDAHRLPLGDEEPPDWTRGGMSAPPPEPGPWEPTEEARAYWWEDR